MKSGIILLIFDDTKSLACFVRIMPYSGILGSNVMLKHAWHGFVEETVFGLHDSDEITFQM